MLLTRSIAHLKQLLIPAGGRGIGELEAPRLKPDSSSLDLELGRLSFFFSPGIDGEGKIVKD